MTTLKIHPNKNKNIEILGKVVYGTYHNIKHIPVMQKGHHQRQPHKLAQENIGEEHLLPPEPRTGICMWCSACICAIIIISLILVGLAVLIVYLLFHPKLPHFDIVTARINRIHLDPTTLLMNAEIVSLVKFINTNNKVDEKYEYINFKLYFRNDLVATNVVEPFGQSRGNYSLKVIGLISSDVELKPLNANILVNEAIQNKIVFQLLGTVKTKARLGVIARVPYWLYTDCQMMFTGPPNGTLVDHYCRTKR